MILEDVGYSKRKTNEGFAFTREIGPTTMIIKFNHFEKTYTASLLTKQAYGIKEGSFLLSPFEDDACHEEASRMGWYDGYFCE